MKNRKYLVGILGMTIFLMTALQPKAYAYLDPGSGGFFLQMLLAALVGLSFTLKTFWSRIKNVFTKFFSKKS